MHKIPPKLIGFLPDPPSQYSQKAIAAFHAYTGQGNKRASWGLSLEDGIRWNELMLAHDIASNIPSGIFEGLWDSFADFPGGPPTVQEFFDDCDEAAKKGYETSVERRIRMKPFLERMRNWQWEHYWKSRRWKNQL